MNVPKERLEDRLKVHQGRSEGWCMAVKECDEYASILRELLTLRSQNEWVKVSERLPGHGVSVLLVTIIGQVCEGWYHEEERCWYTADHSKVFGEIDVWRPLPAAPEEV